MVLPLTRMKNTEIEGILIIEHIKNKTKRYNIVRELTYRDRNKYASIL